MFVSSPFSLPRRFPYTMVGPRVALTPHLYNVLVYAFFVPALFSPCSRLVLALFPPCSRIFCQNFQCSRLVLLWFRFVFASFRLTSFRAVRAAPRPVGLPPSAIQNEIHAGQNEIQCRRRGDSCDATRLYPVCEPVCARARPECAPLCAPVLCAWASVCACTVCACVCVRLRTLCVRLFARLFCA